MGLQEDPALGREIHVRPCYKCEMRWRMKTRQNKSETWTLEKNSALSPFHMLSRDQSFCLFNLPCLSSNRESLPKTATFHQSKSRRREKWSKFWRWRDTTLSTRSVFRARFVHIFSIFMMQNTKFTGRNEQWHHDSRVYVNQSGRESGRYDLFL